MARKPLETVDGKAFNDVTLKDSKTDLLECMLKNKHYTAAEKYLTAK